MDVKGPPAGGPRSRDARRGFGLRRGVLDQLDRVSVRIVEGSEPGVAGHVTLMAELHTTRGELGLGPIQVVDLEDGRRAPRRHGLALGGRVQGEPASSCIELGPVAGIPPQESKPQDAFVEFDRPAQIGYPVEDTLLLLYITVFKSYEDYRNIGYFL